MNEQTHVILTIKSYEDVLNYMSTQPYGNVVQLISELVNGANANAHTFILTSKPVPPVQAVAAPEAPVKKMEVVKESESDIYTDSVEEVTGENEKGPDAKE